VSGAACGAVRAGLAVDTGGGYGFSFPTRGIQPWKTRNFQTPRRIYITQHPLHYEQKIPRGKAGCARAVMAASFRDGKTGMHSHTRLIFGDLPRTALLHPHLPLAIPATACWSRPVLRPAAQPKYVPASHHLCAARRGEGGGAARSWRGLGRRSRRAPSYPRSCPVNLSLVVVMYH
jgi:hypothetical protein